MTAGFVDHLWQSVLVCGAIAACAFATRASRAIFRLWLWRAAALKFVFPFAWLYALGEWLGFPVAYSPDPAPASLVAFVNALTPPFAPGRALHLPHAWTWLLIASCASALCFLGVFARIGTEYRRVRAERQRRERDVNDVLRYPGLWMTVFMTSC